MELKWRRFPAGCDFVTGKARVVAKQSINDQLSRLLQEQRAAEARLSLALDPLDEHEARIHIGEDWADVDPLSDVVFVRGRGECEEYVYNSPDFRDNRARRISLDFANVEANRNGMEEFIRNWGIPTAGLVTERQLYDMHQLVRCILLYSENRSNLREMIFRLHWRELYRPLDPFDCAVGELKVLAEHDVLRRVRKCQGFKCNRLYIAHKSTATRGGMQKPQRFCNACGSRARSKSRRQSLKMVGAQGPTGKKVTADPRHAGTSTRRTR